MTRLLWIAMMTGAALAFTGCDDGGDLDDTAATPEVEDDLGTYGREEPGLEDDGLDMQDDLDTDDELAQPSDIGSDRGATVGGATTIDESTVSNIRMQIADDAMLSPAARQIEVIAADGMVTLRGSVQSEAERERLRQIAVRIAGEANVNVELEVVQQPPQ